MSGILRLESLTKGNTLKQGDKTPLKYRLFDADGEKLNIAGKSAQVRLVYPDFLTIGYEKAGLTVAQDDTVTFTIDGVIPSRIYHVEIIVDDKFIFPSRADESKFTVDKSSLGTETNIVEIVGVDAVVRKAVDLINDDPSLIIDEDKLVSDIISNTGIGSIKEYHQQFNDVITELSEDKDYYSLPEIAGARGGHDTLGARLDETTAQLAHKVGGGKLATLNDFDEETINFIHDGTGGPVSVESVPKDNSVTEVKTTFIDVSPNLIIESEMTLNARTNSVGEIVPDATRSVSGFIEIEPNQDYVTKYTDQATLYDKDFNFLSRVNASTATAPRVLNYSTSTIRYIVIEFYNDYMHEGFAFYKGNTYLPYVKGGSKLSEKVEVTRLGKNIVDTNSLKSRAVTADKTDFIESSKNLVDKKKAVDGFTITGSTGELGTNAKFYVTEPIPVDPDINISSNAIRYALYDTEGKFISSALASSFKTTSDTGTMRLVFEKEVTKPQANVGEVLLPYEEYYTPYIDGVDVRNIKEKSIGEREVKEHSLSLKNMDFVDYSSNLINIENFQNDLVVDVDGIESYNSSFRTSHFFEVEGSTEYVTNSIRNWTGRWVFYDDEKSFLSSISSIGSMDYYHKVTTPALARYAKVVLNKANSHETPQVNKGDTLLPYEPFYVKFKDELGLGVGTPQQNKDDYYMSDISVSGVFNTDVVYDDYTGNLDLLYAKYDELVAQYPEYITKTHLGDESTGLPMYKYDFAPKLPQASAKTKAIPSIFILSGVHGNEKTAVWTTYCAMKEMCSRWEEDELLEALRFNFKFIIIPVGNPYGYTQHTRSNSNGVDINRNFPTADWSSGGGVAGPHSTYGGPSAASELETQYIKSVLDANPDIKLAYDFHNFFEPAKNPANFLWITAANTYTQHMAQMLLSRLTRKWRKDFDFLPVDPSYFVGYTSPHSGGLMANYAKEIGITNAALFEVCRQMPLNPDGSNDDATVYKMSVESLVNWLLINIDELIKRGV